ncbi:MAG: thiamine pyrophosphate-dependent enzyme [Peptococcaceae bacterium]|jgi:2-oxoglutarate ferredoxin oxidoreductase subunit beta|nr:thiamine pyrophosphate-dependent enzyme [Peptococcaceae bacterium]
MTKGFQLTEETAWCPGCGNFAIRQAVAQALGRCELEPNRVVLVSGIGQAAKLPHYINTNIFNGLHGRAVPAATAIKAVNHDLTVLVTTGDGDCYGEGGNHLLHAFRRNPDITILVHDNQVYGLTKGQASPTSEYGFVTKLQSHGVKNEPLNPVALAVAMDASLVARGFAGDIQGLAALIALAVKHRGLSLVDIRQPCVSFNKLNTYAWYRERVYYPEEGTHDPSDRVAAFRLALTWGDRIPLGVIYRRERPVFEEQFAALTEGTLVSRPYPGTALLEKALAAFY